MAYRQLTPVPSGRVKSRLLALLEEQRRSHSRAANDPRLKLGQQIDAAAQAKECLTLKKIVQAMPDEGSSS